MMNEILIKSSKLEFLDKYVVDAEVRPNLQSLGSVQKAFASQAFPVEDGWFEGRLPFLEFSNMVARELGKKRPFRSNCWTRFDGNIWEAISEQYPNDKAGYDVFLSIYERFRRFRSTKAYIAYLGFRFSEGLKALEIWTYSDDGGFALLLVLPSGRIRFEAFSADLRDLMNYSQEAYGIAIDQWELAK